MIVALQGMRLRVAVTTQSESQLENDTDLALRKTIGADAV